MFNKHFGLKKKVAISWFRLCRVQYSVAAFVALLCPSSQGLATIQGRNLWFKDVVTPTPCSPTLFHTSCLSFVYFLLCAGEDTVMVRHVQY